MMNFLLDRASVQAQGDFLEQVRQNILAAIRVGMYEGMEGLAGTVVERLGEVTKTRTGDFAASILRSPRISEKPDEYIAGTVSTSTSKWRNLGLWIEYGIDVPSTVGAAKGVLYSFAAAGGDSVYTHGHAAFRIAPNPFFNPAFQEYYPTILDTINQRIAEACDAGI
jgi:hypothetical protein